MASILAQATKITAVDAALRAEALTRAINNVEQLARLLAVTRPLFECLPDEESRRAFAVTARNAADRLASFRRERDELMGRLEIQAIAEKEGRTSS